MSQEAQIIMPEKPATLYGYFKGEPLKSMGTFKVLFFEPDRGNHPDLAGTVVAGKLEHIPRGYLKLTGRFDRHPKFGERFVLESLAETMPETKDAKMHYLTKVYKLTKKQAEYAISAFRETIWDDIADEAKLCTVPRVTPEKRIAILEVAKEEARFRELKIYLYDHGFNQVEVGRVIKKYCAKDQAEGLEVVKKQPYRLVLEAGIRLETADRLAFSVGVKKNNPARIITVAVEALRELHESTGDTYFPLSKLEQRMRRYVDVPSSHIEQILNDVVTGRYGSKKQGYLYRNNNQWCLRRHLMVEGKIIRRIKDRLTSDTPNKEPITEELIRWADGEQKNPLVIAPEHFEIVQNMLTKNVSLISGEAGTGKSRVINIVLKIAQKMGMTCAILAPTGKAANVISEKTGYEAQTIHMAVYKGLCEGLKELEDLESLDNEPDRDILVELAEKSDALHDYGMVIVDESSMCTSSILCALMSMIGHDTKLVFVGDYRQLPPIGVGSPFQQFLASGVIPSVVLKTIHRQEGNSAIVENARSVVEGRFPAATGADWENHWCQSVASMREALGELIKKNGYTPADTQIISPVNKEPSVGVYSLNKMLQEIWNPARPGQAGDVAGFRLGDKVIQVHNWYDAESWLPKEGQDVPSIAAVFNGDTGIVTTVRANGHVWELASGEWVRIEDERVYNREGRDKNILEVTYSDGKKVAYTTETIGMLGLFYAATVHKLQGSQCHRAIIMLSRNMNVMLNKSLLYTAITRASRHVVMIAEKAAVEAAVKASLPPRRSFISKESLAITDDDRL